VTGGKKEESAKKGMFVGSTAINEISLGGDIFSIWKGKQILPCPSGRGIK
jgi:hypothetical protein